MLLAPYASNPSQSRGRLVPEKNDENRSAFQRDRDRVLHSYAFRRLKHKTQVFVANLGEYYRTRLTHSLEVAQIARSIARALTLNEDLTEAISLAHDLGHGPFGHAGESVIDHILKADGGFNHNDQTFRLITQLERRYALFDGLNLTWETLEGIVKHNGPIAGSLQDHPAYITIFSYLPQQDLDLKTFPSAEAQIAAIADDIAYNTHDIDDGLRAGIIKIDDIYALPLLKEILTSVEKDFPHVGPTRLVHETIRRLINTFVNDVLCQARETLATLNPRSVEEIRACGQPIIKFSSPIGEQLDLIRGFLLKHMYRHPRINQAREEAQKIIQALFDHFEKNPSDELLQGCFPLPLMSSGAPQPPISSKRQIADVMACLTDQQALDKYATLVS